MNRNKIRSFQYFGLINKQTTLRKLKLLLLILSFFVFKAQSQLHTYKIFNHKNGLIISTVWSLMQNPDGGIIIGTEGAGLIEYDGYSFKELGDNEWNSNYHVSSVYNCDGTIIFTDRYKGLYEISKSNKIKSLYTNSQQFGFEKVICIDKSFFLFHKQGITRIDDKTSKNLITFPNSKNDLIIYQSIKYPSGEITLTNKGNFVISSKTKSLIPLSSYLSQNDEFVLDIQYGYYTNNRIHLFTKDLANELICDLNPTNEIKFISTKTNVPIPSDFHIIQGAYNKIKSAYSVVNEHGEIIELIHGKLKKIDYNTKSQLNDITSIISDFNGDYWLGSASNGLIKVSVEPFTKLNFHEEFDQNQIHFCFKTEGEQLIISNGKKVSYIGDQNSGKLKTIPFPIKSATYHHNKLYCGTRNGLIKYSEKTNSTTSVSHPAINNSLAIQFLFSDKTHLWVSQEGEGLLKINIETGEYKRYSYALKTGSGHSYTGKLSFDNKSLYVGGNDGIYRYSLIDDKVERMPIFKMGSYCGASTTDIFGTNWFTIDNGLVGILKNGKLITISDSKYFPSKLFYTINSDNYGNLIIGTNRGLNFIKVNDEGVILNQSTYDIHSGFEGFETNSRADYQSGNEIILGTIEGLFQINSAVFQNMNSPNPPTGRIINEKSNTEKGRLQFSIRSKNPKTKLIYYSYRIVELDPKWSKLSTKQDYYIDDLANGEYTLELKSTYSGIEYSDVDSITFKIHQPYYKTPWFIFLVIFSVLLINVVVLLRINKSEDKSLFLSDEYFSLQKIAPNLILFGAFANTISEIMVSFFSIEIDSNLPFAITIGFVLLSQYFISLNNRVNNHVKKLKINLIIGFVVILGYNIFMMYYYELHPYYALAILIIISVTPFIFDNIKHVSLFGVGYVFMCSTVALVVKEPLINPYLYILATIISALLFTVLTFMRNDSLFKLAFVSAIVNKGNIPTIAFSNDGVITFASKNIHRFIGVTDSNLVHQSILTLNHYIAKDSTTIEKDISNLFKSEPVQTIPMYNVEGEISWIEWTYKSFSDDVKVIIGQVVNDKIEVQNTYELLVQNAEDYIYQVNIDSNFQFVNARFYDRLGYLKSDLIGQCSLDIVAPEYRDKVELFYRNHFKNKEQHSYLEFPILKKDGSVIWLGQYVSTLFKPGSTKLINGFLALARDITVKREQEKIIENQNINITSSINYAQRIQQNLLPSESTLTELFEESFVIFKPKDIVSGDFYWMKHIGQSIVVVVGDSTGHGVPGAFMSLLGINLLNTIVHENQLLNPGRILDEIDYKLREALPRHIDGNVVNDGMEMTMCVINTKSDTMIYSCAGSKILMHNGTNFNLYKGDYKHIGDERTEDFSGYVTHHIPFDSHCTLYLFTDGFQDQFGGRKEKKFSIRRLLETFDENIRLPLSEQSKMISKEFEDWKGDEQQTDDVTIIGLRKKSNF